jgi:hypothetical protein
MLNIGQDNNMVQIPTFKAKGKPTRTAGVATNIPNITGAATAPFEAIARLGNQMQSLAQKDYQNKLDFENKKLQQKTDFEIQSYRQEKNNEQKLYEADQRYKDKVYQIQKDQEARFEVAAFRIKQKQEINDILGQVKTKANDLSYSLQTSNNLNDVSSSVQELTKLKDSLKNNLTDESTKQLLDLEFNKSLVDQEINFKNTVRSNIIDTGITTYNKEIDDLLYTATYSNNPGEILKAEAALLSPSGIMKEMYDNGLITNLEEQLHQVRNTLFSLRSERMLSENPQMWLNLNKKDYWDNHLTTEQIVSYENQANLAIEKDIRSQQSNIKSTISAFNSLISDENYIINNLNRGNVDTFKAYIEQAKTLIDPTTNELAEGVPELIQELEMHVNLVDDLERFRSLNVDTQVGVISAIESKQNEILADNDPNTNITKMDARKLELFKSINSDLESSLQDDMLSTSVKYGIIDNVVSIFNDQGEVDFDLVDQRKEQAKLVAAHYGEDVQFFTKQEAEDLSDTLLNAQGANEIIDVARAINDTFDVDSLTAFKQLSDKAPLLAEIGGQINNGNNDFAYHIANGYLLNKDQDIIPNLTTSSSFRNLFVEQFGNSLVDNSETFKTKQNAIKNAMVSIALTEGWLNKRMSADSLVDDNEERIIRIMNESVGAKYNVDGKIRSGGFTTWLGNTIILPTEFSRNEKFDEGDLGELIETYFIDNVEGDYLLKKAGGRDTLPAATPFTTEDLREEQLLSSNLVFGGPDQEGRENEAFFWETVGPGQYLFSLLDPKLTENPEYLHYPGTNELFIFDLNKIIPLINQQRFK